MALLISTDHPVHPQRFGLALEEYQRAANDWCQHSLELRQGQSTLREAERELSYREAELRLDPLVMEGKNDTHRAALLLGLAKEDKVYQALWGQVEGARSAVQRCQDEMAAARDAMSGWKALLNFGIAWARLLGAEGGEQSVMPKTAAEYAQPLREPRDPDLDYDRRCEDQAQNQAAEEAYERILSEGPTAETSEG